MKVCKTCKSSDRVARFPFDQSFKSRILSWVNVERFYCSGCGKTFYSSIESSPTQIAPPEELKKLKDDENGFVRGSMDFERLVRDLRRAEEEMGWGAAPEIVTVGVQNDDERSLEDRASEVRDVRGTPPRETQQEGGQEAGPVTATIGSSFPKLRGTDFLKLTSERPPVFSSGEDQALEDTESGPAKSELQTVDLDNPVEGEAGMSEADAPGATTSPGASEQADSEDEPGGRRKLKNYDMLNVGPRRRKQ